MPVFFGDVPRAAVVVGTDNGQQWEYPAEELNITTSQRNWDDSLQSCRGVKQIKEKTDPIYQQGVKDISAREELHTVVA